MTTIACNGRSMAGDGQTQNSGFIVEGASRKVNRLLDGRIAGCCGLSSDSVAFLAWLNTGGDKPVIDGDSFGALELHPDGRLFKYEKQLAPFQVEQPAAIGSGFPCALAAMLAGCDPLEAIKITSRLDVYTGGEIYQLSLDDDG